MIKKYCYRILFVLSVLINSQAFAERPAAMDDAGRPAADMKQAAQPAPVVQQRTTGDVLDMQAQPMMVKTLDFPRRGMTKDKVQNELGKPLEIVAPIGKPPISRWVYRDRIVYFEYSSVVHVVAK